MSARSATADSSGVSLSGVAAIGARQVGSNPNTPKGTILDYIIFWISVCSNASVRPMTPPTIPGAYYVISESTGAIQIMELRDYNDGHPAEWYQFGDEAQREDVATGEGWAFEPVPEYRPTNFRPLT